MAGLAGAAEAAGFHSIQVGNHVTWHAPIHEATMLMAIFAAVVSWVCLREFSGVPGQE